MTRVLRLLKSRNLARTIIALSLMILTYACSQRASAPAGRTVAWDQIKELQARSFSERDSRRKDLALSIHLPRYQYAFGGSIRITVILTNLTLRNVVAYKTDDMSIFGCEGNLPSRIDFILIKESTNSRIQGKCMLELPQLGFPPPQYFSVLSPGISRSSTLNLNSVFQSIQPGRYTLQALYVNDGDFGAVVIAEPQSYFVDYDAWLGSLASNIESFQISP